MIVLKERSRIERRVLGAVRFVDATLAKPVDRPLKVESGGLSFFRNRSGLYVITGLKPAGAVNADLAAHLDAFEQPPAAPPVESLDFLVTVEDPGGIFAARSFTLSLPRVAPDPPREGDTPAPGEVLAPLDVPLMRGPAAGYGPNWSGARLSLSREDGTPLSNALVRLIRKSDDELLGESLSDLRGEVSVPVIGIPIIDFVTEPPETGPGPAPGPEPGDGEMTVKTVSARLEILTRDTAGSGPPDPEAILADPQAWVPLIDGLPEPELRTGTVVTENLGLVLRPAP